MAHSVVVTPTLRSSQSLHVLSREFGGGKGDGREGGSGSSGGPQPRASMLQQLHTQGIITQRVHNMLLLDLLSQC